jgi:hypothetical protein
MSQFYHAIEFSNLVDQSIAQKNEFKSIVAFAKVVKLIKVSGNEKLLKFAQTAEEFEVFKSIIRKDGSIISEFQKIQPS